MKFVRVITTLSFFLTCFCPGISFVRADMLTDNGSSVTLDNGLVELTIDKSSARIYSLKKGATEYLGAYNCKGYFQRNADGSFTTPANCTYSVIRNTTDLVEVSFVEDDTSHFPFLFETHFVMKSGESGFYNFTILEYDPAEVSSANLEQLNLTWRVDPSMFTIAQVSDDRWEVMPTVADMQVPPAEEVMDATYLLDPSSDYYQNYDHVYTKYNMSVMFDDHHVHGTCGEGGYGLWQVLASNEYMNGGPETQELTVHQTDTTVVCIRTMCGAHYGSGTLDFDSSDGVWRKIYGPWFIYLNEGPDRQTMWEDAKSVAAAHVSQWPYQWMDNSDYPLDRGKVSGTLNITDGSSPEGATVVLAQPEGGDIPHWQKQGKDYIFWGWAEPNGYFTVEDVRPGTYTLYAFVEGVMDELRIDNITVSSNSMTALGQVDWTPLKYGRCEWQLGIPNRDSTEFRRGDDFRHWGLEWEPYVQEFPNGVDYTIDVNDWGVDWYYVHPATKVSEGVYESTPWQIHFDLDKTYTGTGYLRLGIAGTRQAKIVVYLSNKRTPLISTDVNFGSGCPRSGSRGYYYELDLPFDCSYLINGENRVLLIQDNANQYSNIHWDCIRLELPYISDLSGDLEVDITDLKEFALQWLTYGPDADFDDNGIVNHIDFAFLADEWHK